MTNGLIHLLAESGFLHRLFFRQEGATEHAHQIDDLFMLTFWVSTVSFVILMGLMVLFMVKYRRRPGVAGERSPSHNTPLELFWTIVPTLFLVWFFFEGFWGFADALVAPGNAMELNMTARKWSWEVNYPNGAVTGRVMSTAAPTEEEQRLGVPRNLGSVPIPVIAVPADTPVQFRMISQDVIHSFWVPDLRTKFDVFPNRYTAWWFRSKPVDVDLARSKGWVVRDDQGNPILDAEGREQHYQDHWVFCAEYCGDNHSEMWAILRLMPMDAYTKTVNLWGPAGLPPVEYGKILYTSKGCASCHSVDGSKNTGPTWLDLYGGTHDYTDGQQRVADDDFIRNSILYPATAIRQTYPNQMTPYAGQLDEKQISAMIAYMKTLSKHAPAAPEGQPAPEGTPAPAAGGMN